MSFENRQESVSLSLFSSVSMGQILFVFCVMVFIVSIIRFLGGSEI